MNKLLFFPEAASTIAGEIDLVFFGLLAVTAFFVIGVGLAIVILVIRFHRKDDNHFGTYPGENRLLELSWTIGPLFLGLALFAWGAKPFLKVKQIPPTPWKSRLWANSGCGSFNIPMGGVKLTIYMFRSVDPFT